MSDATPNFSTKAYVEFRAALIKSADYHRANGMALGCGIELMRVIALDKWAKSNGIAPP